MPSDSGSDRRASEQDIESLFSAPEAAKILRSSERAVRGWIASGTIPVVRLGRKVLIRRSDLRRIIRSGI
jgi:excisionase family DNA binding protein